MADITAQAVLTVNIRPAEPRLHVTVVDSTTPEVRLYDVRGKGAHATVTITGDAPKVALRVEPLGDGIEVGLCSVSESSVVHEVAQGGRVVMRRDYRSVNRRLSFLHALAKVLPNLDHSLPTIEIGVDDRFQLLVKDQQMPDPDGHGHYFQATRSTGELDLKVGPGTARVDVVHGDLVALPLEWDAKGERCPRVD